MRKQFFKMKFKAILKIVIPIAFLALLVFMMIYEELETVEVVVMSCTWGLLCLIYIISGILFHIAQYPSSHSYIQRRIYKNSVVNVIPDHFILICKRIV